MKSAEYDGFSSNNFIRWIRVGGWATGGFSVKTGEGGESIFDPFRIPPFKERGEREMGQLVGGPLALRMPRGRAPRHSGLENKT